MVARGAMLGPGRPVILHLLDIPPAAQALEGVRMELVDAAFPLLRGVVATTDLEAACQGVEVACMIGGFPRKKGMERKDVMGKNVAIYKSQASAIERHAAKGVKVVVVANPANTNAWVLAQNAPGLPREDITALTRLDHNRSLGQLAERAGCQSTEVKRCIIWGNHSSTQYPDVNHATLKGRPVREAVGDDTYLDGEFVKTVQQRGAAIIQARNASSALSAAASTCDHVRSWLRGTPKGDWVSMAVASDGSYGIKEGLVYSFPVTCQDGKWKIVQGLSIDERSRGLMDASAKELEEEQAMALECLSQ
mmetsp:Transcript_32590/g.91274  ORF Transcript_32590/g.91274 Transcript_32590/m.91274 type:complete len:307 (+) Transcript_32590:236-1156(+)